MLKKIKDSISAWSFRKRIGIILVLFSIIPSILISQLTMYFYHQYIISSTSASVHGVVSANNSVLEMKFNQIEDISSQMLNRKEYYELFAGLNDEPVSEYMKRDRELEVLLGREFTVQDDIYETFFYLPEWIFGKKIEMNSNLMQITNSGLADAAARANGQPVWIAGYDYGKRIDSEYLQKKESYSYQYPITMVRKMNFQYNYYSEYHRLKEEEVPTLFVYILEPNIRKVYEDSLEYQENIYGISDSQNVIVSSNSERFAITQTIPEEISQYYGSSGYSTCRLDQEEYLLCYDTMENTEWFSWALVPMNRAIQDTVNHIRVIQILSLLACMLVSAFCAWKLSNTITKPVGHLIAATERVANGVFSADTPVPKGKDFKQLTEGFNHMEKEINRLIHENYEVTLREKETQLMALSLQINPHFLYNTLNTINMLAIQNDDEETSDLIVCLSEILQYTFRNTEEKILLVDEIGWLSNYLYIMSKRFTNVFQTIIDIDEELMECKVPRFFLQPLAENSILHGFRERQSGGILKILASREGDKIHFQVLDNGSGMEEESIRRHIVEAANDSRVGISNVHRRLMLIYGEKYRVEVVSKKGEGTGIHLYIPYEI